MAVTPVNTIPLLNVAHAASAGQDPFKRLPDYDDQMIRHAALFRLHHPSKSEEEAGFLAALATLASIPGVQDFEIAREISPKNEFTFAASMAFSDQAAYDAYNMHPLHVAFVRDRWVPEVAGFMEHDTMALHAG